MRLTLRPAYGKVYKNLNAVRGAWCCGEEFFIVGASKSDLTGGYCNIKEPAPGTQVKIQYGTFFQNHITVRA